MILFLLFSLSLNEAVQKALRKSPNFIMYRISADISSKQPIYNLPFILPEVNSQVGLNRTYYTPYSGIANDKYSGNLNISIPIFNLKNQLTFFSSLYERTISRATFQKNKDDFILLVIQTYINALLGKELIISSKKSFDRAKENLDKIQTMYKLGSVSKIDLLDAQIAFSTAQLKLINVEKQDDISMKRLKSFLHIPLSETLKIEPINLDIEVGSLDSLKKIAFKYNPEIVISRAKLSQSKIDLWGDRFSFLPSIQGNLSYSYSGDSLPKNRDIINEGKSKSFSISLNLPIFSGFTRTNNLLIGRERVHYYNKQIEKLKDKIYIDVEDAYQELMVSKKTLEIGKNSYKYAEENEKLVKEKYNLGDASIIELLKAEEDIASANYQLIKSQFDYYLSFYNLKKSVGKLSNLFVNTRR